MSINILNLYIFKIENKINQDIVKYRKNNIIHIFLKFYVKLFLRAYLYEKTDKNYRRIVISHLDSIDNYAYFNKNVDYVKYNKIPSTYKEFFKHLLKIPIYTFQYFRLESRYKNIIYEAYLESQLIVNHVKLFNYDELLFLGYDYDLRFFLASLLLDKRYILQYNNSGFLGKHNLVVVDKLYCRTIIHKKYIEKNKDIFNCRNIISMLDKPKISESKVEKSIAVYTSGYYARMKLNFATKRIIKKGMNAENEMINSLKRFAMCNKDINIVLFIHLHNGIENLEDSKEYYKDFLSLKNVRLQDFTENSIENFNRYNLGICVMSEIFFDRYERGFKTILMNPFILNDFIDTTALKKVTLYSNNTNIIERINYFLNIDTKLYFELLK